jgi:hypothetical protein
MVRHPATSYYILPSSRSEKIQLELNGGNNHLHWVREDGIERNTTSHISQHPQNTPLQHPHGILQLLPVRQDEIGTPGGHLHELDTHKFDDRIIGKPLFDPILL